MTEQLPLSKVALDELAEALDDRGDWTEWWFDSATGRIVLSMDEFVSGVKDEVDTDGMIAIDPLPAGRAYDAMVEFADAVGDPRGREGLRRSLEGKGAFRRFRRALDDFPELGTALARLRAARVRDAGGGLAARPRRRATRRAGRRAS